MRALSFETMLKGCWKKIESGKSQKNNDLSEICQFQFYF